MIQCRSMSEGGGIIRLFQPNLSSGSTSLSDPTQVETAMQVTSSRSDHGTTHEHFLLLNNSSNTTGFSNAQRLKRIHDSPLPQTDQFRTLAHPINQMAGRNNFPPSQQATTYHQQPRPASQTLAVNPAAHGAFRAIISPPEHKRDRSSGQDHGSRKRTVRSWGNRPLAECDPDLWEIMQKEKLRQHRGIELIASENFTSLAVFEALGSHLTNKYSEGLPGSRYYKGNEHIDQIESLCIARALAAFHLDAKAWGVNVQPYSCSSANFAVYTALLQPHDRIMGLDVLSGGHLSHGYHTHSGKKIPAASIFFQTLPFKVDSNTGLIDYDNMEEIALLFRPKILICGGSSYPREWNYARFRAVADKINAVLMCDMAHISGLVAAQACVSPFEFCDVVTTTTHKSLRGPRGGMVFFRRGVRKDQTAYSFEKEINMAVHPTIQGGPHNNHVAALAVALKQVSSSGYKDYIHQVKRNAQALAEGLKRRGFKLVTDGTDNHLVLWDLRPFGVSTSLFEEVCEACCITVNKSAVYGDSSSFQPGGVRVGTPAMTSRGCDEADFEVVAEFLHRAVVITQGLQRENAKQPQRLGCGSSNSEIVELRAKVEEFASRFEMPGFEVKQ